jgi:hypothetical protein
MKAALAVGAWAPWTSIGYSVAEDDTGDVWTMRTSVRVGRFTVK